MRRTPLTLLFVGFLGSVLLCGCSSPPPSVQSQSVSPGTQMSESDVRYPANDAAPVAHDRFPRPPELEPQVAFWRQVYGTWSRSQVALHDDRYLAVVYEVVELPGAIEEGYSAYQKDLIRERKEYWQAHLRSLEQAWTLNSPLTGTDRALVARLESAANEREAVLGAAERVRVQRGLRERFKRGLEISGRYDRTFRRIFREAGLPEDLAYLPHVESSFQAQARSSAGAVGIWQFTRGAARRFMNMNDAVDERLDPVASARGAARYLSHAHEKLSSWPLTLTSYNHGIAGMQKARDSVGDDFMHIIHRYDHPKFGFASRNFYAEFLAACDVASQPGRYFPEGLQTERPLDWERIVLDVDTPVSELARQYDVDSARLIAMNAAWSEPAKQGQVPLPAGTDVWLSPGMIRDADRATAWRTRGAPAKAGRVPSGYPAFGADPD